MFPLKGGFRLGIGLSLTTFRPRLLRAWRFGGVLDLRESK